MTRSTSLSQPTMTDSYLSQRQGQLAMYIDASTL